MKYNEFLNTKIINTNRSGFDTQFKINPMLFLFQKNIVKWALKQGKAAIFADCGLGKTPIQLEWAWHVHKKENKPILIFAPLAVSKQTQREGVKFNIDVNICESSDDVINGINITNYEKVHKFDLSVFVGIVLDESSILKSYSGKFKNEITEKTKNIKYKLACTATPAPNDFMELGNHSEFLGVMTRSEMLAMFFIHDSGSTQKWRLKGHASNKYWKWLCTWAVMIRKPSDLGYKDDNFILPEISINEHIIECAKPNEGELFVMDAITLQDRQKSRRTSIKERTDYVAKLINGSDESWLIWCNLNDESLEITKKLNNATEIAGRHTNEYKEDTMLKFSSGDIKILVSKPKLSGFGMNWQHCNNVVFVGLSDSYEQYYQAVRRCWRFGQQKKVNVYIIVSNAEGSVLKNIHRKEKQALIMASKMVQNMKEISSNNIHYLNKSKKEEYMTKSTKGKNYEYILGDCIEEVPKIETDSIDYTIFSPPFAELYTYSDSIRDMGNSKNYDEFFVQFGFLVKELNRITKPGRLVSVHCIDIPAMKERDGYIGIKDFPGDIIRLFQSFGFIYHSRVTIWKNPLIEATRTKALGLMHKQLCKDSSKCRQGLPDYLVTFRKKGNNETPIDNGQGLKKFIGENKPTETGLKYSHEIWRRYASPVWMDINQSNTLNKIKARGSQDDKHICPLQLDTIGRGIELWSNENETVFDPFGGIASSGHEAILMNRKFKGIELKKSYWEVGCKNLHKAENLKKQDFLNI